MPLGEGHLLSLCPHGPVMSKKKAHLATVALDGSGKALTALLLLRLMGHGMLLLKANKITTALAPLMYLKFTVLYTSRYPFTIYRQKTPVLCHWVFLNKKKLNWCYLKKKVVLQLSITCFTAEYSVQGQLPNPHGGDTENHKVKVTKPNLSVLYDQINV